MGQVNIIILLFITSIAFGQKGKLPRDGYFSPIRTTLEFSRQTGKLENLKNDSLRLISYKTDSSEMILEEESFTNFRWDNDRTEEELKVYLQIDSLVTPLFRNGLMTSDLLLKAYNAESKYIDHKGDTVDFTNHTESKIVYIDEFRRMELPLKYKGKKNSIAFEGKISFYASSGGRRFVLFLKSGTIPKDGDMTEYLKQAKIRRLEFVEKTQE